MILIEDYFIFELNLEKILVSNYLFKIIHNI